MEDCPNAKRGAAAAAAAGLPDELILEILSRVTARSIHRFKCVSKHWRDLIADPLHQKRLPQTLEGFFCSALSKFDEERFIRLPGRSVPLVDPVFFLKQHGIERPWLMCSCNGLLLFVHSCNLNPGNEVAYAVFNPATEQLVAVPSTGLPSHLRSRTYLAFDPAVSPHFHLVLIRQKDRPDARIEGCTYSSETRLWRDWVSDPNPLVSVGCIFAGNSGCSAFVNDMLHFIAIDMQKNDDLIVAMDREGNPRIIRRPPPHENGRPSVLFVAQSQGRLHCVTNTHLKTERGLSLWVLEGYDAGHWVLKHSASFSELFGKERGQLGLGFDFRVVSIHPDCDLVFFMCILDSRQEWKLISYDMQIKKVHALHNLGHYYCSLTLYVPYFSKSLVLANKH